MSESPTRYSRLLAAIGYSRELNLVDSSEEQSELLEWIATACTGTLEEMQGEILLEQEELTLFATALKLGVVTPIPPNLNDLELDPSDLVTPGYLTPSQIHSTLERNQSTTQRLQDALNSNTRRLSIINSRNQKSQGDQYRTQQATARRQIETGIDAATIALGLLQARVDAVVALFKSAINAVSSPELDKIVQSMLAASTASVENLKSLVELFPPSPKSPSISAADIKDLAGLCAELYGTTARPSAASPTSIDDPTDIEILPEAELRRIWNEELEKERELERQFEEVVMRRQAFIEHSVRLEIEGAIKEQKAAELEALRTSMSEFKSFLHGEIGILSTLSSRLSASHVATAELVALISAMIHVLGEETPYIAPRQFETESDSGERDEKLLEALHSISKAPLLDRGDIRLAMQEVSGRFDEVTAKHHAEIVASLSTAKLFSATVGLYSPTSIHHSTSTTIEKLISSAKAAEKNAKRRLASPASQASDLSSSHIAALSRLEELLQS